MIIEPVSQRYRYHCVELISVSCVVREMRYIPGHPVTKLRTKGGTCTCALLQVTQNGRDTD